MSLFLKIFIWFWLAMALVSTAFMIAVALTESDHNESEWRQMTGTAVRLYAQTAAELYERDGQGALVIYLQRVEQTAQMETRIYDAGGTEVSGRPATQETKHLAEVADRIQTNDEAVFDFAAEPKPFALVAQKSLRTYRRSLCTGERNAARQIQVAVFQPWDAAHPARGGGTNCRPGLLRTGAPPGWPGGGLTGRRPTARAW